MISSSIQNIATVNTEALAARIALEVRSQGIVVTQGDLAGGGCWAIVARATEGNLWGRGMMLDPDDDSPRTPAGELALRVLSASCVSN